MRCSKQERFSQELFLRISKIRNDVSLWQAEEENKDRDNEKDGLIPKRNELIILCNFTWHKVAFYNKSRKEKDIEKMTHSGGCRTWENH